MYKRQAQAVDGSLTDALWEACVEEGLTVPETEEACNTRECGVTACSVRFHLSRLFVACLCGAASLRCDHVYSHCAAFWMIDCSRSSRLRHSESACSYCVVYIIDGVPAMVVTRILCSMAPAGRILVHPCVT